MKINNSTLSISILVICLCAILSGCYYDNLEELRPPVVGGNTNNCDTTSVMLFATNIKPIFSNNCGTGNDNCHSSTSASGGVDLVTYAGVKSVVDDGRLVSAIKWDAINSTSQMPKGAAKMNDCNIRKIVRWVSEGAANN